MKPYSKSNGKIKGVSGTRQSKDTPHRRRCLRRDKKAARAGFKAADAAAARQEETRTLFQSIMGPSDSLR